MHEKPRFPALHPASPGPSTDVLGFAAPYRLAASDVQAACTLGSEARSSSLEPEVLSARVPTWKTSQEWGSLQLTFLAVV